MELLQSINAEAIFNHFEVIVLVVSIIIIVIIQSYHNSISEKKLMVIEKRIAEINQKLDIQATVTSQFNDHFSNLQEHLGGVEDLSLSINRDISTMMEGINGEIGVSKGIEMARRGSSLEEIIKVTNLSKEQAELIYKFHGEKKN